MNRKKSTFPKYFSLENFRVFQQRQDIQLEPITILTGPNSSGKSTVIKSLLLLKENGIGNDLDFSGASHQLGSFSQALNSQTQSPEFHLRFPIKFHEFKSEIEVTLSFCKSGEKGIFKNISIGRKGETPIFESWEPQPGAWAIKTDYESALALFKEFRDYTSRMVQWFEENKENSIMALFPFDNASFEILAGDKKAVEEGYPLLDSIVRQDMDQAKAFGNFNPGLPIFNLNATSGEILSGKAFNEKLNQFSFSEKLYWEKYSHHMLSPIWKFKKYFDCLLDQDTLLPGEEISDGFSIWTSWDSMPPHFFKEYSARPNSNSEIFAKFIELLRRGIERALAEYDTFLKQSIHHLPSIRGNTRRVYSDQDNVSSFTSLLKEFVEDSNNRGIPEFLNWALKEFEIGESISIERHEGVLSIPYIHRNGGRTNLADLGFGVTQFIPILLKICLLVGDMVVPLQNGERPKAQFLMIEEPEANLHPKLQSKLADLFYKAYKEFNIHFILETHSEYMIRKFQYLVASKRASENDLALFYFNGPGDELHGKAHRIEFRSDGILKQDFGPGFYDEATRLTLQMMSSRADN